MSENEPDDNFTWVIAIVFGFLFVGEPSIFKSLCVLLGTAAGLMPR